MTLASNFASYIQQITIEDALERMGVSDCLHGPTPQRIEGGAERL